MVLYSYLREVLLRFKYYLGGGSLLLILAGIIEHFIANSITWVIYLWILVACFVLALITHGASQYKRLMPRIMIGEVTKSVWPAENYGFTGAGYYFDVLNLSESESIENARAELVSLQPAAEYLPLPVPLKIKHDDYETREFSIHPRSIRQIDLITGPVDDPKSQKEMIITHTVNADRVPVPYGKYRLTVSVGAKNIPPATAVFEAWIDERRELRCVRI
jgi:hypothetical protein